MTGHNEARGPQAEMQAAMAAEIAVLMVRYSFDLGRYSLDQWIEQWLEQYPALWLHGAVVEALYQGRYKAVSVWQILDLWQRRGKPLRHFNREFERMVAGRTLQLSPMPESTAPVSQPAADASPQPDSILTHVLPPAINQPPMLVLPGAADIQPQIRSQIRSQIQPYRPSQQFHLSLPEKILMQRSTNSPPIQQFVPTPETSEFHSKLKSIAHALVLANAQIISASLASRRDQPPDYSATSRVSESVEASPVGVSPADLSVINPALAEPASEIAPDAQHRTLS